MPVHLSAEQRQLALRLKARGLSLRQIGPQVGCSHELVRIIARQAPLRPVRQDRWTPGPGRLTLADREEITLGLHAGSRSSRSWPVTGRLRSPPCSAAASGRTTARPSPSRQVRRCREDVARSGPERRALSGPIPPASAVLGIPLRGTRLRRAVDPGASTSPLGPTARAKPKARPETRAANLQRHRCG